MINEGVKVKINANLAFETILKQVKAPQVHSRA